MIIFGENEKVYLIKRRHKFVLFAEIVPLKLIFLTVFGLTIAIFFISPTWPNWLIEFIPEVSKIELRHFLIFLFSLLFLILWISLFVIITNYYLDCWIVTNQRTIHTELKGFFRQTISTVPLERIQDISVDIHGFFSTILKYGDVHIQTAGESREFVFRQISNPVETKEIILKARDELLTKKRVEFSV